VLGSRKIAAVADAANVIQVAGLEGARNTEGAATGKIIDAALHLSGYRGASLGMTWLASRVVETVDVGEKA
jgi:hypothetical protein